jgi:hypothetical protein
MVVSVAMLAMAAIGRLLTRRATTERREPQRPPNHFNGRRVIARDALKNCAIPLAGSARRAANRFSPTPAAVGRKMPTAI